MDAEEGVYIVFDIPQLKSLGLSHECTDFDSYA